MPACVRTVIAAERGPTARGSQIFQGGSNNTTELVPDFAAQYFVLRTSPEGYRVGSSHTAQ